MSQPPNFVLVVRSPRKESGTCTSRAKMAPARIHLPQKTGAGKARKLVFILPSRLSLLAGGAKTSCGRAKPREKRAKLVPSGLGDVLGRVAPVRTSLCLHREGDLQPRRLLHQTHRDFAHRLELIIRHLKKELVVNL